MAYINSTGVFMLDSDNSPTFEPASVGGIAHVANTNILYIHNSGTTWDKKYLPSTLIHRDLVDETDTKRVEVLDGGEVEFSLYDSAKDDGTTTFNRNLFIDATGVLKVGNARSSFLNGSGRFYCFTNNRWVTESDDIVGSNNQNMRENSGTAATPDFEWEHLGTFFPAGTRVKALNMLGRANNNQVSDLDIIIVERKPTDINAYQNGYDADGEMTNTILFQDTWQNAVGSFAGNMNDIHGATIPINHTMDDLAQMSIYIRPVGAIAVTRYFYATWTWETI